MSDDIIWADELPARTGRRLLVFVDKLKANPGKWGRYNHAYAKNGASSALTNARLSYPDIEWERRGDYLWGRYTPSEDVPA